MINAFKVLILLVGMFSALQLSWPIAPPPNYGLSMYVFAITLYMILLPSKSKSENEN